MELIVSLKSVDMYNQVSSFVDGIVLGCDYSFYSNNRFSVSEIKSLISKAKTNNIKVFILLNIVMHNEYVNRINDFINEFKNDDVYFIYQDLGFLNMLNKYNLTSRGIYNPITMITNYMDLLTYDSLGVDAVGVSNEIPLTDINVCASKSHKVFYLGFGYHPMYQTYRKIASLYKEYSSLDYQNDNLAIKELSKDQINPMIENEFGSIVFRCGVISILEKIELASNVKYLFLDGIFLDEKIQLDVYKIYYDVINKNITKEEGLSKLNKLNLSYSNRFMNEDSVYNPEDF